MCGSVWDRHVYFFVCVMVCTNVHLSVKTSNHSQSLSTFFFFEKRISVTISEAYQFRRQAGQQAPWSLRPLTSQCWVRSVCHDTQHFMWPMEDSNSDSHACVSSVYDWTISPGTSLSSFVISFFTPPSSCSPWGELHCSTHALCHNILPHPGPWQGSQLATNWNHELK